MGILLTHAHDAPVNVCASMNSQRALDVRPNTPKCSKSLTLSLHINYDVPTRYSTHYQQCSPRDLRVALDVAARLGTLLGGGMLCLLPWRLTRGLDRSKSLSYIYAWIFLLRTLRVRTCSLLFLISTVKLFSILTPSRWHLPSESSVISKTHPYPRTSLYGKPCSADLYDDLDDR